MKIMLINGPPSSGKDTLARSLEFALMEDTSMPICHFERFSFPLKRAFAGVVAAPIDSYGNVKGWENIKDKPMELLGNRSYRQWQIDFSERFMKPLYGEDIFGRLFCHRISTYEHDVADRYALEPIVVVPDSGFAIEIDSIRRYLPTAKYILVRLHRDGTNFDHDSRSYLNADHFVDIENNSTEVDLVRAGLKIIQNWDKF